MTLELKHNFVSPIVDQGDATLLGPNEWNDDHATSMATNKLLGRGTAGTGAIEEITLGTNLSFTGTTLNSSGGLADSDYGDVTVSGSGTVITIDNDVVTFAKMQNVTTARLLGRATAGTGDTEEITLGTNLSFTGTTLNAASGSAAAGGADTQFQWNNATVLDGANFYRTDANTISQFNGTNAQVFHQYITRTDASNYERLEYTTNAFGINFVYGTLGSGVPRAMSLTAGGTAPGAIVVWQDGDSLNRLVSVVQQTVRFAWDFTNSNATIPFALQVADDVYTGVTAYPSGTKNFDIIGGGFGAGGNPGQVRLAVNGDVHIVKYGLAITWTFSGTSPYHFLASTDNQSDIGQAASGRPRDVRIARDVYTGNTAFMHRTTGALADGAGAGAGTLGNAPAAGNPTKWIPIDDNGTTRYIPAW